MAISKRKPSIRHRIICVGLSASIFLTGCGAQVGGGNPDQAGNSAAEIELRGRSAAMQKTVVEAIAVGALAGAALGFLDKDENGDRFGGQGVGGYLLAGAIVGAVAGSYVVFLQDDFATKEERLKRARADIQANNAEIAATIKVMQAVLNNQIAELNRLREAVAAGTADSAQLDREVQEAQANLQEMQRAASGAAKRHKDFRKARRTVSVDRDEENINAELAELSSRIAQMRAIADALAEEI